MTENWPARYPRPDACLAGFGILGLKGSRAFWGTFCLVEDIFPRMQPIPTPASQLEFSN
jgi:hypothetical protein